MGSRVWIVPFQCIGLIKPTTLKSLDSSFLCIELIRPTILTLLWLRLETAAINWALELTVEEGFENIIVERDAKICVDAFSCPIDFNFWKICSLTAHSLDLALKNFVCVFNWVTRDVNQLVHALAKVVFSLSLPFICNCNSLPPCHYTPTDSQNNVVWQFNVKNK